MHPKRKQQLQELSHALAAAYIQGRHRGRNICKDLQLSKHCDKGGLNKLVHPRHNRVMQKFRSILQGTKKGFTGRGII